MGKVMNIYEYKQKTENTSVVFYSLLPTCGLYRDFPKNITDNNMSLSSIMKISGCLDFEYFDDDYSHVVRGI